MDTGLQITLSPEIAAIVTQEAARQGKPVDVIANDAIRQRYAAEPRKVQDSGGDTAGRTLADRLAKHIGVIDTGGADLSVDTSQKYSDAIYEAHQRKRPS